MSVTAHILSRRIDQARGRTPADLVIKGVTLFNLVTGDLAETDIAVTGDTITGTYGRYDGSVEIDGRGLTAVPGFIDTHLHVESSLITPAEFELEYFVSEDILPDGVEGEEGFGDLEGLVEHGIEIAAQADRRQR